MNMRVNQPGEQCRVPQIDDLYSSPMSNGLTDLANPLAFNKHLGGLKHCAVLNVQQARRVQDNLSRRSRLLGSGNDRSSGQDRKQNGSAHKLKTEDVHG